MPPIGPRSLHLLHLNTEEFLQRPQHLLILEPLQYGLKAVGMLHQRPQMLWLELCPGPVADDVPGVSHGVPAKIGRQFTTRLKNISKINFVTSKSNPNFEKLRSVTLVSTLQDFGVQKSTSSTPACHPSSSCFAKPSGCGLCANAGCPRPTLPPNHLPWTVKWGNRSHPLDRSPTWDRQFPFSLPAGLEDAKYLGVPVVNNKIWKEGTGWAAYRITASSGQITQHTSDTNRN